MCNLIFLFSDFCMFFSHYSIKDNIWTRNSHISSSSCFLSRYFPGKDSSLKENLDKSNNLVKEIIFDGNCGMDEFACGWTGLLGCHKLMAEFHRKDEKKIITNPHDSNRIIGGSSSESAFLVSVKKNIFSIATDTGGSIIVPSYFSGTIGFKPSYGLISRYGVIPMASSLDTVGIISNDIDVIRKVFFSISKEDYNDLVTISRRSNKINRVKEKKIILIKNIEEFLKEEIRNNYLKFLSLLSDENYSFEYVDLPEEIKDNIQLTYFIIACSEIFSHLNSLKGITFANKEKKEIKYLRSLLGEEVKKRILFGCFFLKNKELLIKARRVRSWVNKWVDHVFLKIKGLCIVFPTMNNIAPEINEINDNIFDKNNIFNHWTNNLFLLANFSGVPSINLPFGSVNRKEKKIPLGICLIFFHEEEEDMLSFSNYLLNKLKKCN